MSYSNSLSVYRKFFFIIFLHITGKENTVLRAKVHQSRVSVIPNAVDTSRFTPKVDNRPKNNTSEYFI